MQLPELDVCLVFQVRELLIVARVVCVGHKPLRFRRGGRVQAEQSAREGTESSKDALTAVSKQERVVLDLLPSVFMAVI